MPRRYAIDAVGVPGDNRVVRQVWVVLAVALSAPTANAYAGWHLTDLGTLGGAFSRATAINDARQIVGYAVPAGATTSTHHCFLWEHGTMRDLGALPGAHDCWPTAIDAAGDIAGTSGDEAFFWRDGRFTDLGHIDPAADKAVDMNAHGWVVVLKPGGAFIWHDGRTTPLELPHGRDPSIDWDVIADNGNVVGTVSVLLRNGIDSRWHAVVWNNDGKLRYLPELPGATSSWVWGMNASGVITGENDFGTGVTNSRAVVWKSGTVTAIVTPPRASGRAVDGLGEVGVYSWGANGQTFVWSNGTLLPVWNGAVEFSCANAHLLAGYSNYRAFVWMNDALTWLPGRESEVAGVNAHDQVVGSTGVKGPKIGGTQPIHAALWSQ
jgi:probable HAF family extracellular repeat protein